MLIYVQTTPQITGFRPNPSSVSNSQIVGSVSWATGVVWPDPFGTLSRIIGTVASPFDILPVDCIRDGVNFYSYMYAMTLGPLALVSVLILLSRKWFCRKRGDQAPRKCLTQNHALSGSIVIAFLFLPCTSLVLFRLFVCTDFANGNSYLDADLRIKCSSLDSDGNTDSCTVYATD